MGLFVTGGTLWFDFLILAILSIINLAFCIVAAKTLAGIVKNFVIRAISYGGFLLMYFTTQAFLINSKFFDTLFETEIGKIILPFFGFFSLNLNLMNNIIFLMSILAVFGIIAAAINRGSSSGFLQNGFGFRLPTQRNANLDDRDIVVNNSMSNVRSLISDLQKLIGQSNEVINERAQNYINSINPREFTHSMADFVRNVLH